MWNCWKPISLKTRGRRGAGPWELAAGMVLLSAALAQGAAAAKTEGAAEPATAGRAAYEREDYEAAARHFEAAVQARPQDSSLHHWLGKSYGRIADDSGWLKAMSYAKKTVAAFRMAVELDAANPAALRDLISYLEQAPGFLGGDKQEAEAMKARLATLEAAPAP